MELPGGTYLASRMATIQPEHSDSEVARNSYCRKFSRRYEMEKQCCKQDKPGISGVKNYDYLAVVVVIFNTDRGRVGQTGMVRAISQSTIHSEQGK